MKNKFIITVVGHDTVGIIAKVCTYLAEHQVNILDISQTIVSGLFTMILIADISDEACDFQTLKTRLEALSQKLGVEIRVQRSEIFEAMHQI